MKKALSKDSAANRRDLGTSQGKNLPERNNSHLIVHSYKSLKTKDTCSFRAKPVYPLFRGTLDNHFEIELRDASWMRLSSQPTSIPFSVILWCFPISKKAFPRKHLSSTFILLQLLLFLPLRLLVVSQLLPQNVQACDR